MKKFKFKLESVLKVRETRKKIMEKKVSALQAKLNKIVENVEQVRLKKEQSYHHSFSPGQEPLGDQIFWMELCGNYRKTLVSQEKRLEEQKRNLEIHLQLEKKELVSKLREEKVMTVLKETQLQAYLQESDRFEQKEVEELDLLKRGKKQ